MVLLTRQLSNLNKILTCYNNWRVVHNLLNLENFCSSPSLSPLHSVPWTIIACCQRTSWNGIPACLPAVRCIHSESPQRNKLCVMPYACKNRCAYVAHINLRNIKRAQKHFPLSEDVWLDAWRGGMLERDIDGEVSIDVKSSHLFRCN